MVLAGHLRLQVLLYIGVWLKVGHLCSRHMVITFLILYIVRQYALYGVIYLIIADIIRIMKLWRDPFSLR